MAANRALETDHASPLYRDPYARELAGEAGFDVLYSMRTASGMGPSTGPDPFSPFARASSTTRLLNAVRESSIDQVVILAAGMDARAFRLEWPAGVRVFEVDRDDVFAHKEAVLTRLKRRPRATGVSCGRTSRSRGHPRSSSAGFEPRRRRRFSLKGCSITWTSLP